MFQTLQQNRLSQYNYFHRPDNNTHNIVRLKQRSFTDPKPFVKVIPLNNFCSSQLFYKTNTPLQPMVYGVRQSSIDKKLQCISQNLLLIDNSKLLNRQRNVSTYLVSSNQNQNSYILRQNTVSVSHKNQNYTPTNYLRSNQHLNQSIITSYPGLGTCSKKIQNRVDGLVGENYNSSSKVSNKSSIENSGFQSKQQFAVIDQSIHNIKTKDIQFQQQQISSQNNNIQQPVDHQSDTQFQKQINHVAQIERCKKEMEVEKLLNQYKIKPKNDMSSKQEPIALYKKSDVQLFASPQKQHSFNSTLQFSQFYENVYNNNLLEQNNSFTMNLSGIKQDPQSTNNQLNLSLKLDETCKDIQEKNNFSLLGVSFNGNHLVNQKAQIFNGVTSIFKSNSEDNKDYCSLQYSPISNSGALFTDTENRKLKENKHQNQVHDKNNQEQEQKEKELKVQNKFHNGGVSYFAQNRTKNDLLVDQNSLPAHTIAISNNGKVENQLQMSPKILIQIDSNLLNNENLLMRVGTVEKGKKSVFDAQINNTNQDKNQISVDSEQKIADIISYDNFQLININSCKEASINRNYDKPCYFPQTTKACGQNTDIQTVFNISPQILNATPNISIDRQKNSIGKKLVNDSQIMDKTSSTRQNSNSQSSLNNTRTNDFMRLNQSKEELYFQYEVKNQQFTPLTINDIQDNLIYPENSYDQNPNQNQIQKLINQKVPINTPNNQNFTPQHSFENKKTPTGISCQNQLSSYLFKNQNNQVLSISNKNTDNLITKGGQLIDQNHDIDQNFKYQQSKAFSNTMNNSILDRKIENSTINYQSENQDSVYLSVLQKLNKSFV